MRLSFFAFNPPLSVWADGTAKTHGRVVASPLLGERASVERLRLFFFAVNPSLSVWADGTAKICGRVVASPLFRERVSSNWDSLFLLLIPPSLFGQMVLQRFVGE